MIRRVVVLVVLVAGLVPMGAPPSGAAGERYLERVFAEVTVTRDVAYGAARDEHGARQELNVDVYRPVGDTLATRPAIVLAHGGGFVEGSKAAMAGAATAYARRGFVALSIEYRMDEGAGFIGYPPDADDIGRIFDAKHDMQAAVRWLRAHAGTYGVDPQRVAVGGYSAGAVMALLVATTPDDPGASGTPGVSSKVCTAVAIAGAGEPALVDPGDAGAIFFHGDQDRVVPYAAAVATRDAMAEAGLPVAMTTFPGTGHAVGHADQVEQEAAEWLKAHVVDPVAGCAGPAVPANAAFVKAAHQDLLGRAATADEVVQQAGYLDAGGSRSVLLGRLTTSDEWLGSIVTGFYADTLGRQPDAAGLAFWVGTLRSGRYTVAQVAASFYAAPEYRRGRVEGWVGDLYDAILGRAPSAADVAWWSARVRAHGPTWVAVRVHGSIESRRDRVTALYQHLLGRAPERAGLEFWADRVATAGDLALARDLAASAEYRTRALSRYP
ncbi:MAG TPA: DUF4214 domain-containing protein [Iamia sp.]|nr:DUF4214 domain-containing protein [Iamia sp.]